MFRPPNPPFSNSTSNTSPQGSSRHNKSFTFPNNGKQAINTIDEDFEDSESSKSSFDYRQPQNTSSHSNPFEKSFQNLDLSKVSSIDSDSTLVGAGTSERVPTLHRKNGSHVSVSSVETLSSFKMKRFNSTSSIPSIADLTMPSNSSLPPLSSFKKAVKYSLPEAVTLISNVEISQIIDLSDTVLVIDVRPFIDFNTSHLRNSINFNLPSTLLKRPNFTLQKCLNNLSLMENLHLKKFLYEDITNPNKKIVIYDEPPVQNDEITLSIHGALNKFLRYEDYNGKLYVLGDGFQSFKGQYPELLDAEEHEDLGQSPTLPLLQTSRHFHSLSDASSKSLPLLPPGSISLSDLSASSLSSLESSSGLLSASVSFTNTSSTSSPISPNLSRFHLPKLPKTPIFKIRHNEESYDFHNYKVLHEFKYLNATTSTEVQKLPQWLQNLLPSLKENVDEQAHNPLIEKFKILEMDEKKRINDMISSNSIGYGIELGSKNRYKDIFPYEHSRVKLSSTPTSEVSHEFDLDQSNLNYINANFISSPNLTDIKYIATQAPLNGTLKDFNKLIRDNNIEIIIALTNQFENGVEKCYPYWKDTSYYQIIEEEKLPNIIIRRLKITNYDIGKEIIQIQILNWLDYDIMVNSQQDDVLKLIFFKRFIMERLNIWNENVLVHCSAGCGRTGTFCTLDTIINVDDHRHDESLLEKNEDVAFDPVFNIVENFRNQRISMVQNLRQYLFIYDCLCNYFENFQQFEKFHTEFKDLTILNNFIQQRVCHEEK